MSEPGVIAGRYALVRRIGAGAMGTVWLARDETLHREVAVKQVTGAEYRYGEGAETARRRAMREGRMIARLSHPNAVGIFDVVMHDGQPWLVMEYVRSQTLTETVRASGPLEPARASGIGAQLADALAEAHRVGVVHRDVKPGNVLLSESGTAKITDFGIARGGGDTLTETGLLAATPAYVAPETARGADPAPSSDVWSLGATLYFAVEGQPPFSTEGSPLVVLARVANSEVPAPVRAGALAPVLMRLLSRDPADRPTMAQAREMLQGVPAGSAGPGPEDATVHATVTLDRPPTATVPLRLPEPLERLRPPEPLRVSEPARRWAPSPGAGAAATPGPGAAAGPAGPPTTSPTPSSDAPPASAPGSPPDAPPASAPDAPAAGTPGSPLDAPPGSPPDAASGSPPARAPGSPLARAAGSPPARPPGSPPDAPPASAPGAGRTSRSRRAAWLAACAVVLALAGLGWYLLGGHPARPGDSGQRAAPPAATSTTAPATDRSSATTSPTTAPPAQPTAPPTTAGSPMRADAMTRFVADYYRLLPENQPEGWRRLGPDLKQIGYDSYTDFWSTIRAVSVRDLSADPASATVTGTVVFTKTDGRVSTERHAFALVTTPDGTGLLIDRDRLLRG